LRLKSHIHTGQSILNLIDISFSILQREKNAKFSGEIPRITGKYLQAIFSPTGKYVVSTDWDGTAVAKDNIRVFCALLTRDLTPEERQQFNISGREPTCMDEVV
jgi:hypothetical protein